MKRPQILAAGLVLMVVGLVMLFFSGIIVVVGQWGSNSGFAILVMMIFGGAFSLLASRGLIWYSKQ